MKPVNFCRWILKSCTKGERIDQLKTNCVQDPGSIWEHSRDYTSVTKYSDQWNCWYPPFPGNMSHSFYLFGIQHPFKQTWWQHRLWAISIFKCTLVSNRSRFWPQKHLILAHGAKTRPKEPIKVAVLFLETDWCLKGAVDGWTHQLASRSRLSLAGRNAERSDVSRV